MTRAADAGFSLLAVYETATVYYVFGASPPHACIWHLIKVYRDRDSDIPPLEEDPGLYTDDEKRDLLLRLSAEARAQGGSGVRQVLRACAFLGAIRFLESHYLLFATAREQVGCFGPHAVFRVSSTALLPVTQPPRAGSRPPGAMPTVNRRSSASGLGEEAALSAQEEPVPAPTNGQGEARGPFQKLVEAFHSLQSGWGTTAVQQRRLENRYRTLFLSVDVTKDCYFSHSYDLTRTLQDNFTAVGRGPRERYLWNHFLAGNCQRALGPEATRAWVTPLVHGFFSQVQLQSFGRTIRLSLVARRCRQYAGVRLLKRGINASGDAANEVETEQVVWDEGRGRLSQATVSSAVQLRGSIPILWGHAEGPVVAPRPDILLFSFDPMYEHTHAHLARLAEEYGQPVVIFSLIRQFERRPRETFLGPVFSEALRQLQDQAARDSKDLSLTYVPLDYKRESQRKGVDMLALLAQYTEPMAAHTGHFVASGGRRRRKADGVEDRPQRQTGIVRTNCIDCLDRTNVAQYSLGLVSLCTQLSALDLIPQEAPSSGAYAARAADGHPSRARVKGPSQLDVATLQSSSSGPNAGVPPQDHSAVRAAANTALAATAQEALCDMYERMGTQIALQYGGSHMVHAMHSNAATNLMHSVSRFYSNTFTDMDKQAMLNLFLGKFRPRPGGPHVWELPTDHYLHNGLADNLEAPLGDGAGPRTELVRPFDRAYVPGMYTSLDELLAIDAPRRQADTPPQMPSTPSGAGTAIGGARRVASPPANPMSGSSAAPEEEEDSGREVLHTPIRALSAVGAGLMRTSEAPAAPDEAETNPSAAMLGPVSCSPFSSPEASFHSAPRCTPDLSPRKGSQGSWRRFAMLPRAANSSPEPAPAAEQPGISHQTPLAQPPAFCTYELVDLGAGLEVIRPSKQCRTRAGRKRSHRVVASGDLAAMLMAAVADTEPLGFADADSELPAALSASRPPWPEPCSRRATSASVDPSLASLLPGPPGRGPATGLAARLSCTTDS